MHSLIRAMPPVCRAVPGGDDPHEQLTAALADMVDAIARAALAGSVSLAPPRRGRRPLRLPAAEAWLTALSWPDGRLDGSSEQLEVFGQALLPWDGEGTGLTGPARVTFRLAESSAGPDDRQPGAEPDDDDSRWQLDFLLQSVADPSLLVPAAQVWADDGSLARWLARPQELLLGELGRGVPGLPGAGQRPTPGAARRARILRC